MTEISAIRLIKRYGNRKLYDTLESRYITLEDIARLVRSSNDVKVIDNESGDDLTTITFAQIILEEEKRRSSLLSLGLLRDLIQHGEHTLADLRSRVEKGVEAFKAAVREFLQPPSFFEALGVRYVGPVDGHSLEDLEESLRNAVELSAEGPIVVPVLTQKGRGYPPAEDDDEKNLHDAPVFDPAVGPPPAMPPGYTQSFADAIIKEAELDPRLVAITAAMPGPTGLLPFQSRFPDRFFDVGIAEQHAVTAAAGMAMGGLRPVVAIYSTFLNRAWDQVVYDVAMHRLPVIFCLDRAGVTGPDGASHHGVYDMALLAKVPGMRVLAPSSAEELQVMLHDAVALADEGPVVIRYPRGTAHHVSEHEVGVGIRARQVREGDGSVAILAIGKMVQTAEKAAARLAEQGVSATVWDVRCCAPIDPSMIADAARHGAVVTIEDGIRDGGIGMTIAEQVHELDHAVVVRNLGIPAKFIPQGDAAKILAAMGLDADGLVAAVQSLR